MQTPAATKPSIFMWPTTSAPTVFNLANILETTTTASTPIVTTTATTSTSEPTTSVFKNRPYLQHKDMVSATNAIDNENSHNEDECK